MDFRKAVKVALAKRGMQQKDLAVKLHISPQSISNSLKVSNVNMERLAQYADALEMKPSELLALGEDE